MMLLDDDQITGGRGEFSFVLGPPRLAAVALRCDQRDMCILLNWSPHPQAKPGCNTQGGGRYDSEDGDVFSSILLVRCQNRV